MDKPSLESIKIKIEELALILGASFDKLPSYGQMQYDAHPYIEVDNFGCMFYIVSERGQELIRQVTYDQNDLLYWVFQHVTFKMASEYELNHRIEDKDSRRIKFSKQEELLALLSSDWRERISKKHFQVLINYPFDDLAGIRAAYFRELRSKGYSEGEIKKMAYEKYPAN